MIKRTNQLLFRVSDDELQQIEEKMNSLGFRNREAYIRKMVLDGYCIRLDLKDLRELTKQMHAVGNNLNQYARWANESGHVNQQDMQDIRAKFNRIYEYEKRILGSLQGLS